MIANRNLVIFAVIQLKNARMSPPTYFTMSDSAAEHLPVALKNCGIEYTVTNQQVLSDENGECRIVKYHCRDAGATVFIGVQSRLDDEASTICLWPSSWMIFFRHKRSENLADTLTELLVKLGAE